MKYNWLNKTTSFFNCLDLQNYVFTFYFKRHFSKKEKKHKPVTFSSRLILGEFDKIYFKESDTKNCDSL